MHAVAEVKTMFPAEDDRYLLVSLGTGESTRQLTDNYVNLWGYVQWSRPMLELVMESISESVHSQMRYMLPPTDYQRYYRIQMDLPEHTDSAFDNASRRNMQALTNAAAVLFEDRHNRQDLDSLCETLLRLSKERAELTPGSTSDALSSRVGYAVALCYADQDREAVAHPLAEALRSRGINPLFHRFDLHPEGTMRRLILQATESAMITVVVLSPVFLRNSSVAKQLKWLYAKTLGGKNVIVPVLHGFDKEDISELARDRKWYRMQTAYLSYLIELSAGSTREGIESLADRLVERIRRWLD
jgi:hypothetical protein